jgi:hypothetical protein
VNASASQHASVSASPAGANAESNTAVRANQQNGFTSSKASNPGQNPKKENGRQSSGTAAAGQLASGTAIHAVLAKPLDARKNKQGDPVVARTTAAVRSKRGVVIPKGSQILGHVTQASVRGKGQTESALGIMFDRAVLKNGAEVPLDVAVQAIAAAQTTAPMQSGDDSLSAGSAMSSGAATAGGGLLGGVGAGAGAGVLTNTTTAVGSNVGGTLGSATSGTTSLTGELSSNTTGVVGIPGMALQAAGSSNTDASVISSASENVHLQSGTQMLLMSK